MPDVLDQLEDIENSKGGLLAFLRCAGSRHTQCHILSMLKHIRDAHRAGRRWEVQQLIRVYLTSYDARLAATNRAFEKMKPGRRPPRKQLPSIASGLNAFKGTQEEVRLIFKRKRSNPNEFRPTLDFGIENRALQYLVVPCPLYPTRDRGLTPPSVRGSGRSACRDYPRAKRSEWRLSLGYSSRLPRRSFWEKRYLRRGPRAT